MCCSILEPRKSFDARSIVTSRSDRAASISSTASPSSLGPSATLGPAAHVLRRQPQPSQRDAGGFQARMAQTRPGFQTWQQKSWPRDNSTRYTWRGRPGGFRGSTRGRTGAYHIPSWNTQVRYRAHITLIYGGSSSVLPLVVEKPVDPPLIVNCTGVKK